MQHKCIRANMSAHEHVINHCGKKQTCFTANHRCHCKDRLNFEIHICFANAFESTLPLPQVHDLSSRWLVPGLADVVVPISLRICKLSSQNLLLFLNSGQWSSGIISRGGRHVNYTFNKDTALFEKVEGSMRNFLKSGLVPESGHKNIKTCSVL